MINKRKGTVRKKGWGREILEPFLSGDEKGNKKKERKSQ